MPASSADQTSSAVTADIRYVTAEWGYQVSEKCFKERPHARLLFHYAVLLLDSILLIPPETLGFVCDAKNLQMVMLVCLYETSRYLVVVKKIPNQPKWKSFFSFIKDKYKESQCFQILRKVENLSSALDPEKISVEVYHKWNLNEPSHVHNLALVLMDSYILDYSSLKHPAGDTAAASVAVARKLIYREAEPMWREDHHGAKAGRTLASIKVVYDEVFYVAYLLFKDPPNTTAGSEQPVPTSIDEPEPIEYETGPIPV